MTDFLNADEKIDLKLIEKNVCYTMSSNMEHTAINKDFSSPKKKMKQISKNNVNDNTMTSIMTDTNNNSTKIDYSGSAGKVEKKQKITKIIMKPKVIVRKFNPEDFKDGLNYEFDVGIKNDYFRDKIFKEIVDTAKLQAVLKMPDLLLRNDWWEEQGNMFKDIYGRRIGTEQKHLTSIFDRIYVNGDEHSQKIDYNGCAVEYGRVYPKNANSLSLCRRPIRHYLCNDIYYDFDFINAHPVIHLNNFVSLGYDCEYLGYYILNRDIVLKRVMKIMKWDRDTAKTFFIAILNGGSLQNYCERNGATDCVDNFMVHYANEVEKNVKAFCNEKKYKKLYDAITSGVPCNKNNRFMAFFGQMWEEQLLRIVFDYAVDNEMIDFLEPNCILAHDGIMFPKSVIADPAKFVKEVNKIVAEKTGLKYMRLKNKPMDEHTLITDEIERRGIDDTIEWEDWFFNKYNIRRTEIGESFDTNLRNAFLDKQKEKYILCDNEFYRLKETGLYECIDGNTLMRDYEEYMKDYCDWVRQMDRINSVCPIVNNYKNTFRKMKLLAGKIGEKCEEYDIDENVKLITGFSASFSKLMVDTEKVWNGQKKTLLKKVKDSAGSGGVFTSIKKQITDIEFGDKINRDDYLIGFENGLMCLKNTEDEPFKQEIRNAEEGEYVSFSVGYDYPIEPSEEVLKMKEWAYSTINNMFRNKEDTEYVLKAISRSLRGARVSNPEQIVMFLRGEGGNGKSLLMSMNKKVFGKYASNNFHSSYLQHTQKDERSTIIWGLKLRRFIAGEEPDKNLPFKADLFKNFAGGVIPARTNYATDNEDINIGCLWIASNFFVQFDSDTEQDSLRRRIRGIDFHYTFVEEKDYDAENPRHKLRDNKATEYIETEEFKQGYMLLLLEYLKKYDEEGLKETEQIKKDTAEYFENINSKKEWFKDNLEPLDKVNLSSQNLREYYNARNGTKYSAQGFNKIMTEMGYKKSTSNAITFTMDSQGNINSVQEKKNVKCYLGITLKEVFENEELMDQLAEAYKSDEEIEEVD